MKVMKGIWWPASIFFAVVVLLLIRIDVPTDAMAEVTDPVCIDAGLRGKALGLCNSYCISMDCDSENPNGSANACNGHLEAYRAITGEDPPCIAVQCPCLTAAEMEEIVAWYDCGCSEHPYTDFYGATCYDFRTNPVNSYVMLYAAARGGGYGNPMIYISFCSNVSAAGGMNCRIAGGDYWALPYEVIGPYELQGLIPEEVEACQRLLLDICEQYGYPVVVYGE